jgi:hypothetical protein
MTVRAFYRAAKVENAQPPYDTIYLKVIDTHVRKRTGQILQQLLNSTHPLIKFYARK